MQPNTTPGAVVLDPAEINIAAALAHRLGSAMTKYAMDKDELRLGGIGDLLEEVAVSVGYVARPAHPFSGERAMQRMEIAIKRSTQQAMADMACKAQERDHSERQARSAAAEVERLKAENERLRAMLGGADVQVAA